jgi:3-dehydroquinate dehydratase/shikimate dehydrogenase
MAKVCVPVCVQQIDEMQAAMDRAAQVANIVEVRLDCLKETPGMVQFWRDRQTNLMTPVLLTLRAAEQGGKNRRTYDERRSFWRSLSLFSHEFLCDLELDLVLEFAADSESHTDWERVMCSHHDFEGVPDNLDDLYARMACTPARLLKIAVHARDATDCLPVFDLLERARSHGRDLIAIAMGPAGVMTRILGPSRGSFLTYGALDEQSATAPGQLAATQLRDIYRVDEIDRETEILGIIGAPVSHSLSPRIHNAAFAAAGLNAVYLPLHVQDAVQFMQRMAHPRTREMDWNLRGLSVTAPHKSTVMQCLDSIEPAAKAMGAVNTIVARDHQLAGFNTDAAGFIQPLLTQFGDLKGAHCALIGTGGSARACVWALNEAGCDVTIFARDPIKAGRFAESFQARSRSLANADFSGFDIAVNATPLGTTGELENVTPVTAAQLGKVRLAYDLVYNPLETRFLREATIAGCKTLSGVEMLLAQALEQFRIWTGHEPDQSVMRAAALAALRS